MATIEKIRDVVEVLRPRRASDGDGVKLLRVFSGPGPERFDPFLMLDEFGSDVPEDYRGGFPPHPHRGFETVTYMLHGKMEHRDHLGNVGLLSDGGVQWMTAGSGIIHSEMPRQTEGLMRGFQLWVNLPAAQKMTPASYRDIPAEQIPLRRFPGASVKAIAGEANINGQPVAGFFAIPDTEVIYLDIRLDGYANLEIGYASACTSLLYVFDGALVAGAGETPLEAKSLARLGGGHLTRLANPGAVPASVLLMAGLPLGEPIAQYGPFVMNTMAEVEQAMRDYQAGKLV